jgi:transketolase
VFVYSIANFATLRCLEQIRNDICYHSFAVTIVAVGAGLAYGNLGFSHHGVQDIAALRCMPNITIASPADPGETRGCLAYLLDNPGPSYLRLVNAGEPSLHSIPVTGLAPVELTGTMADLAIVATGSIASVALEAASRLHGAGIPCSVFSVPFLAPATAATLAPLWHAGRLISIEEHVAAGGLGSLLRELSPDHVRIRCLAVSNVLASAVGSQSAMRRLHGLHSDAILHLARTLTQ